MKKALNTRQADSTTVVSKFTITINNQKLAFYDL